LWTPGLTAAWSPHPRHHHHHHHHQLDELPAKNDPGRIQTALGQLTGARSVPRVFIDGQFIGGACGSCRALLMAVLQLGCCKQPPIALSAPLR
jgi:glutaredoxin